MKLFTGMALHTLFNVASFPISSILIEDLISFQTENYTLPFCKVQPWHCDFRDRSTNAPE
jgi:hypothetical protein